jgi:hypothetical protein
LLIWKNGHAGEGFDHWTGRYASSHQRATHRAGGLSFSTALGVASLTESDPDDVAVAILCHTLSPDEKRSAIEAIRDKSPRAMILHLRTLDSRDELPEHASSTVMDGPHQLLTATHDLIRRWENHLK